MTGKKHAPRKGRLIVYANHISGWDPALAGSALTRQVFFMTKQELFANPMLRIILLSVGAFPVKRGQGDRAAMRRALELLSDERAVGMFPEGTRRTDGRLGKALPGAALLAIRSKAPLLPIAITGPYRLFRPTPVTIGEPYELTEFYDRKLSPNDLDRAGEILMQKLADLLEQRAKSAATGQNPELV